MDKFISGATPYTDAERKRDAEDRKRADELHAARRKATPSRQNYNKRGTRHHQALYRRQVGSE